MKYLRYPINFYTSDIFQLCDDISSFLGCKEYLKDSINIPIGDSFFIGPIRKFTSNQSNQASFAKESTRFIRDERFLKAVATIKNIDRLIARGYYLPESYSHSQLPLLILYKEISTYSNKPVIISENFIRPGEFVLVPENIEVIATISFYDEINSIYTNLPEELVSISFFAEKEYLLNYFLDPLCFENKGTLNGKPLFFTDVNAHKFKKSFFEERYSTSQLLTNEFHFTQIYPILKQELHSQLLYDLEQSTLWVKRHGDTYSQLSLDILEISNLIDCPRSIQIAIKEIKKPETINAVSKISGVVLSSVKEICAFRMKKGELLDLHADNTRNGELLVRFNWLLQSPKNRKHDLRFKKDESVYCCQSLANSATIFQLGSHTPHDVTPIPFDANCDRINILLTFG